MVTPLSDAARRTHVTAAGDHVRRWVAGDEAFVEEGHPRVGVIVWAMELVSPRGIGVESGCPSFRDERSSIRADGASFQPTLRASVSNKYRKIVACDESGSGDCAEARIGPPEIVRQFRGVAPS
jgi:hypothetical protein